MSDNKCPNCQIDLNTTAQFCRRCGFKVSAPLVSASVTEATTRNLPNPPAGPDFRQTNNFGSAQFGQAQMPGSYPPPSGQQQMTYTAMAQPVRRSNGPKILLIAFLGFAFMAFLMVAVLIGPFARNRHRVTPPVVHQPVTVSGTSYAKSFKLPADGQISLSSISGKIDVSTYDGDTIEFKATRSDGSTVSMDDALDMILTDKSFTAKVRGGRNASVNYELKMPRKFGEIALNTISGNINLEGIEGKIKISSTSGEVSLEDIGGSVDLNTVSGDQSVKFKNSPNGDLKFNSTSGDVKVTFLTEPDLKVAFGSITGDVESDFPLEKTSRPASSTAKGVLGKGLYNMTVHTISGDLTISK